MNSERGGPRGGASIAGNAVGSGVVIDFSQCMHVLFDQRTAEGPDVMARSSTTRRGCCRASLDLCLSCKACWTDCPTGVDMATYKSEVLNRYYRGHRRTTVWVGYRCGLGWSVGSRQW